MRSFQWYTYKYWRLFSACLSSTSFCSAFTSCCTSFYNACQHTAAQYSSWARLPLHHGWFYWGKPYQLAAGFLYTLQSYRGGNTRILFLLLGLHISGRGLLLGLVITLAHPKGPSSYHHTLRDCLRPRRIPGPPIRPSSYCRTQCGVLSVSGYHARTQLP